MLLLRGRQNVLDHELAGKVDHRDAHRKPLAAPPGAGDHRDGGIVCRVPRGRCAKVYFDYNLLNMQSEGLPAVEFAKKLIDSTAEAGKDGDTNAPPARFCSRRSSPIP